MKRFLENSSFPRVKRKKDSDQFYIWFTKMPTEVAFCFRRLTAVTT